MRKDGRMRRNGILIALLALLLVLAIILVSCGDSNEDAAETSQGGTKLPPGMTEEELEEGESAEDSASEDGGINLSIGEDEGEEGEEEGQQETQEPDTSSTVSSADLAGARFTVVDAPRNDSNQKVLMSGQREVPGDYLEVELAVENVGDELVDLSQYSFRLESPGIEANDYYDYYGENGTFGKYVSKHVISAVLMDYADLAPVGCKLKISETLEDVFLFFDLNPLSTAKNEGFTKDNANNDTNFIIRKVRGNDAGEEVKISLAGYPD
jgi:hypothetical protein